MVGVDEYPSSVLRAVHPVSIAVLVTQVETSLAMLECKTQFKHARLALAVAVALLAVLLQTHGVGGTRRPVQWLVWLPVDRAWNMAPPVCDRQRRWAFGGERVSNLPTKPLNPWRWQLEISRDHRPRNFLALFMPSPVHLCPAVYSYRPVRRLPD